MPSYHIEFVGGGLINSPLSLVVCNDDHQALHWAADQLAHHLGAEVFSNGRKVGWVTTANNQAGVTVIFARN